MLQARRQRACCPSIPYPSHPASREGRKWRECLGQKSMHPSDPAVGGEAPSFFCVHMLQSPMCSCSGTKLWPEYQSPALLPEASIPSWKIPVLKGNGGIAVCCHQLTNAALGGMPLVTLRSTQALRIAQGSPQTYNPSKLLHWFLSAFFSGTKEASARRTGLSSLTLSTQEPVCLPEPCLPAQMMCLPLTSKLHVGPWNKRSL